MNDRQNRAPGSTGTNILTKLAVSSAILALTACGGSSDEAFNVPDLGAAHSGELNAAVDVTESTAGSTVTVSVLQNDSFNSDAKFQLNGQPANGTATLLPTGEVQYTANLGFEGTDIVEYLLIDSAGTQSVGQLYVAVASADGVDQETASLNNSEFPLCETTTIDNGDGYGFENDSSCVIPATAAAMGPLTARADVVDIEAGGVTAVRALANDLIADRSTVSFSIDSEPTAGRIKAVDGGVVVYAAPESYNGHDSMMYSITDSNGDTSVTSIDFNIVCASCVDHKALRLSWPANPEAEGVDGYRVLFGSDENPLTSTMVSDVKFKDGQAPEIVFDLEKDLNIASNEGGCFMIQAYRGAEVSEASDAACFVKGS